MMGLCCFIFFLIHPFMCGDSYPHSPPPPQLLVVSHVAVMLLLLFTTGRLTLIFALPWLSVLCWLLFTSCPSFPPPCPPLSLSVPSIVLVWPVTIYFPLFLIFILTSPPFPHLPPLLPFSPSFFLTLVMSALACYGVTNHPLRNLRAKSKHPPTQKPCITIGCFLLATTYLALCLLLCVRPLACPALPWLAAASSCPLCDWLCWWRTCSSPKYGLLADRYHFCEKCFNEIQGESVSLGDDPSQPQT